MKKNIFKAVALILVLTMVLGGCGKKGADTADGGNSAGTVTTEAPQQSTQAGETATGNETAPEAGAQSGTTDSAPEAGTQNDTTDSTATVDAPAVDEALTTEPESGAYIELALNIYYNDADHSYYKNEAGSSIFVTGEGTYEVTFDCAKDLSADATAAGVDSLKNLTAVYLLDMGVAKSKQSPMTACKIKYDAVTVNGTSLTVTQESAKSAFKSSGVFDTNDPINAWDGSQVAEIDCDTATHVANFSTVDNATTITVRFTLSDMSWNAAADETPAETAPVLAGDNTAVFSTLDLKTMDAITLTKYLGNGINLGNTMEAFGRTSLGTNASVRSYETFWGQPYTTAEMVQGMKNCGFDTLRVPISWTNMMNFESGDYTINKKYMDRVEEIVNYALDAEMFVIINDHWDGGWWSRFGSSTPESADSAFAQYKSMWSQIAERFKDYSYMLIFESANEELGDSLNNNSGWADSGKLSKDDCYNLTNRINQEFVNVIRSSGGNNTDRFLLIAGYNTDIEKTLDNRYVMPTDTVAGKLFVSVHYYTPWNYCGAENDARWGLKSEIELMNKLLKDMTKFTNAGYGVIIGEYGALPVYDSKTSTHTLKQNTYDFTNHFLDNCDIYNYCPVLWSCNDFYKRNKAAMITEELAELFAGRSYEQEAAAGDDYLVNVKANMDARLASALEMWEDVETYEAGTPVAWIMWNGGAGTYSVGDVFNPADNTAGITATNAIVEGPGEYTVSLDFAGGNDGLTFAALAIADAEILYPNCVILIQSITLDGVATNLIATPYTSSDDGKCTRVNLYNGWVSEPPKDARTMGNLASASPIILDKTELVGIHNITINFRLIRK